MNLYKLKLTQIFTITLFVITNSLSIAQTKKNSLFKEIQKVDSLFFEAYNTKNLKTYSAFISPEIEFYHDKNGMINSKNRVIHSLKKMIEKEKNTNYSIKRKLVKESLEVYEIPLYGAIEKGIHQFIEVNKDGQKSITQAKFIHLWKYEKDKWVITKVFSFDHTPVKEKINPDKKRFNLTQEQMDIYLGDYQFGPQFILTIVKEGNKMYGLAQGDKIEIMPYELHKFLITTDNSKINFLVNQNNVVVEMEMENKKGKMKAKKIK